MPNDYIIPNYATKKVSEAKADLAPHNIGIKVRTSAGDAWHTPSATELDKTIVSNASISPPNIAKPSGEWVGVEVGPV